MRQVVDTLVWLAMIMVIAAVVYFTPRLANYVTDDVVTRVSQLTHETSEHSHLTMRSTGRSFDRSLADAVSPGFDARAMRMPTRTGRPAYTPCRPVRLVGHNRSTSQLFKKAIASAVRLRMSSIWSVDWKPMMNASTVPSPST